jgi:hypothetical protein
VTMRMMMKKMRMPLLYLPIYCSMCPAVSSSPPKCQVKHLPFW